MRPRTGWKSTMLAAQTRQLQQGSNLVLQGTRIGALQYFGALASTSAGWAPCMRQRCPGRQQQRFGGVGKAIAGKYEGSAGFQP